MVEPSSSNLEQCGFESRFRHHCASSPTGRGARLKPEKFLVRGQARAPAAKAVWSNGRARSCNLRDACSTQVTASKWERSGTVATAVRYTAAGSSTLPVPTIPPCGEMASRVALNHEALVRFQAGRPFCPVAQSEERLALNQEARGSRPLGATIGE